MIGIMQTKGVRPKWFICHPWMGLRENANAEILGKQEKRVYKNKSLYTYVLGTEEV
jgi:hypothetical protein